MYCDRLFDFCFRWAQWRRQQRKTSTRRAGQRATRRKPETDEGKYNQQLETLRKPRPKRATRDVHWSNKNAQQSVCAFSQSLNDDDGDWNSWLKTREEELSNGFQIFSSLWSPSSFIKIPSEARKSFWKNPSKLHMNCCVRAERKRNGERDDGTSWWRQLLR